MATYFLLCDKSFNYNLSVPTDEQILLTLQDSWNKFFEEDISEQDLEKHLD